MKDKAPIPDYVAKHEKDHLHDEVYIAELLFFLVVHHYSSHVHPRSSLTEPLRIAICKLHVPEEMLSYPGTRVWDIDLTRASTNRDFEAFPVETALLREVLACRVMSEVDATRTSDNGTARRRRREVHQLRRAGINNPEEECPVRNNLAEGAKQVRLIRVHHQSMLAKRLTTGTYGHLTGT